MRKALFCSMLVASLALIATTAQAQPYRLLFETDADSGNPNELINVNFSSYADLLAGNTSGQESLDLNVNSAYSVAELMNDGGTYRLLFETDADSGNPNELIAVNFNSYADLLAGNTSSQESLNLNVNSAYSVAGLLNDGGIYRLLFETDADSANPNELIAVNFNSYADLLAGNTSGQESIDINVNAAYSVAGLLNDGGIYRLLFETDADSANPNELINVNFNSYADLLAGNSSGQESLDLNVNSAYSVAAILMEAEPVPEPATLAVIGLGVAALGRRKNRKG